MKRYIKTPLKYALPLLVICVLILTSTTGCTDNTATPTPTVKATVAVTATEQPKATPTATPTANPTATPTAKAPTAPSATPTSTPQANGPFIYSTASSSKVYHYPWCSYVSQMKEANKATFSSSAQAQAAGYHPCSRCKPP